jgi:hypothetical protein
MRAQLYDNSNCSMMGSIIIIGPPLMHILHIRQVAYYQR